MSDPKKRVSFWDALRQYPPVYIRLLAKRGRAGWLSDADIAIASGIELNRIREIKMMVTWNDVTIGEALRYILAANFDPTLRKDRDRAYAYSKICEKRNVLAFQYYRKSPKWEGEIIPCLRKWSSTLRSAA